MGREYIPFDYITLDIIMIIMWWLFLQFNGSRSVRVLGFGTEEYRLVTRGTTYCFCMIIIVAFFLKVEFTRLYMLISYPLGIISLAFMRWLLRQGLVRWRKRGRALTRVLIISDVMTGRHLHQALGSVIASGLCPTAFYLPGLPEGTVVAGDNLPVLGYSTDPAKIMQAVQENNIHMVAVSNGHHLTPTRCGSWGGNWLMPASR